MAITIEETGNLIRIINNNVEEYFNKNGTTITSDNNIVILNAIGRTYRIDYNNVVSPVVASAGDLKNELSVLINNIRNIVSGVTVISSVTLNSNTSIKIASVNVNRQFISLSNNSIKDIWIKLQVASVDNDKKGIFMPKNSYWEMPQQGIYYGEISAISDNGTPDIYITEY